MLRKFFWQGVRTGILAFVQGLLHMVMLDEAGGVPATEALVGQDGSSDDRLDRHGPGAAW